MIPGASRLGRYIRVELSRRRHPPACQRAPRGRHQRRVLRRSYHVTVTRPIKSSRTPVCHASPRSSCHFGAQQLAGAGATTFTVVRAGTAGAAHRPDKKNPAMLTKTLQNPFNLPSRYLAPAAVCSRVHIDSAMTYMREIWDFYFSFSCVIETHQIDFLVCFFSTQSKLFADPRCIQTSNPLSQLPSGFQEEISVLLENSNKKPFEQVFTTNGSVKENAQNESSYLPLITHFFEKSAHMQMPNSVPPWLDSAVEKLLPALKHFSPPKKIYEIEHMVALVRLLLGLSFVKIFAKLLFCVKCFVSSRYSRNKRYRLRCWLWKVLI